METYYERLRSGPPFKPQEEMKYELLRLSSYENWPFWAGKRPCELAKNGLHYSGKSDSVICFSCNGELANWTIQDKIYDKHRKCYPMCAFIGGKDTENVPSQDTDSPDVTKEATNQITSPTNTKISNNLTQENIPSQVERGTIQDVNRSLEEFAQLQSPTRNQLGRCHSDSRTTNNSETTGENSIIIIQEADRSLVKYEGYRLNTFQGNWPDESVTSPAELAKAGFYYVGRRDRVQCAFCKGRLLNWKPSHQPMAEHERQHPDCPFVLGARTNNVSLDDLQQTVQIPANLQLLRDVSPSERLGIMMDRPHHKAYATEGVRLDSYKTWPKKSIVHPEKLASAGFFYISYSDNVRCFFCDGGLRDWQPDKDPWTEHARWFSRCGFLRLMKEEKFIEAAKADAQLLMMNQDNHEASEELSISRGSDSNAEHKSDQKDVKQKEHCEDITTEEELQWHVGRKKKNRKKKNKPRKVAERSKGVAVVGGDAVQLMQQAVEELCDPGGLEELVQQDEDIQILVKSLAEMKEERRCKICFDEDYTIVFLPCGHVVCCANCAPALNKCPLCRQIIKGSVRLADVNSSRSQQISTVSTDHQRLGQTGRRQ